MAALPKVAEIPDLEVDPITLDIIENALRHARFEMDAVLFRSAMSPVIREQHDEFPMLTDPQGRMVVGQFGAYINEMMSDWDRGIYPGDVILTSDPYKCSASISHTNDWLVLVPIFFEGPAKALGIIGIGAGPVHEKRLLAQHLLHRVAGLLKEGFVGKDDRVTRQLGVRQRHCHPSRPDRIDEHISTPAKILKGAFGKRPRCRVRQSALERVVRAGLSRWRRDVVPRDRDAGSWR
jgi:hypothetical protein